MTGNCDLAFVFGRTDPKSLVMRRNNLVLGRRGGCLGLGGVGGVGKTA